jgi:hypothetical protein
VGEAKVHRGSECQEEEEEEEEEEKKFVKFI